MAVLGRRQPKVTPPPHASTDLVPRSQSLVASAARVSFKDGSWNSYRFGDDTWQQEAWRLYDCVGEGRFAANWIGSCCSRVRIYVADVDKNGRVQQETEKPKVAALADTLFGGPPAKAEALRMLGINLTVAGDAYIIGRSVDDKDSDEWYVVSCSELRRMGRGDNMYYAFIDPNGKVLSGNQNRLDPERDIIIRVWTPHPRRNLWADSPFRGAMPMLLEIERLTKFVFAQIDSRLVSAGIVWLPKEASFPSLDGDMTGAEALTDAMMRAASISRRGEDSAAGVVPFFVELPTDALGKVQMTQFTSELSQQARELREEALSRFATAMDMPPEILKGTGDTNHWCEIDTTQTLTQDRGWVNQSDLVIGDMILTLNHETGMSEWQPVLDIYRADVTDEPMLRIDGRMHHSTTTMGHRWPVLKPTHRRQGEARYRTWEREWTTSKDLVKDRGRLILASGHADLPQEPKYTDPLVETLAWMSTDANLTFKRHNDSRQRLVIRQSRSANPEKVDRIRTALTGMMGPSTPDLLAGTNRGLECWRESDDIDNLAVFTLNADATEGLLELAPGRLVEPWVIDSMTRSQLEMFLHVSLLANGSKQTNGSTQTLFSVDPARLDAAERAAVLLGYRVSRGQRNQQTGFGDTPVHWLSVGNRTVFSPTKEHVSEVSYTGTVWCPTTANGTWFARTQGGSTHFTGNSSWHVEESAVKVHIEPLMTRICDGLTTAYLRSALEDIGEDPDRFVFWYDTAPLTVRPQRLQDTLNMYEKGLVNDEAVITAGDYKLTDMLTDEQKAQRFLRELMLRDPNLFQIPSVRELAGITEELLPAASVTTPVEGGPGVGPPPPPPPPTGIQQTVLPPIPVGSTAEGAPTEVSDTPIVASMLVPSWATMFVVCEAVVVRALELAGKRLLSAGNRGQFKDVPPYELHTRIPVTDADHAADLMTTAWSHLHVLSSHIDLSVDTGRLRTVLEDYCTQVLVSGQPHQGHHLGQFLRDRQMVNV